MRILLIALTLLIHGSSKGSDLPQWFGNLSLAVSHGLNYHLDGNKTILWDEYLSRYQINRSTSYKICYGFTRRLTISFFYEHFNGIYQDSISLYNEELIHSRSGNNVGIGFSYNVNLSKRLSIIPRLGVMRRKGHETYLRAYYGIWEGQFTIVELRDIGLTSGLTLNYSIGKGISVFALADYTRFIRLYSSESGERDFYDGPTLHYIRTRIGLQYSLSHLLTSFRTSRAF